MKQMTIQYWKQSIRTFLCIALLAASAASSGEDPFTLSINTVTLASELAGARSSARVMAAGVVQAELTVNSGFTMLLSDLGVGSNFNYRPYSFRFSLTNGAKFTRSGGPVGEFVTGDEVDLLAVNTQVGTTSFHFLPASGVNSIPVNGYLLTLHNLGDDNTVLGGGRADDGFIDIDLLYIDSATEVAGNTAILSPGDKIRFDIPAFWGLTGETVSLEVHARPSVQSTGWVEQTLSEEAVRFTPAYQLATRRGTATVRTNGAELTRGASRVLIYGEERPAVLIGQVRVQGNNGPKKYNGREQFVAFPEDTIDVYVDGAHLHGTAFVDINGDRRMFAPHEMIPTPRSIAAARLAMQMQMQEENMQMQGEDDEDTVEQEPGVLRRSIFYDSHSFNDFRNVYYVPDGGIFPEASYSVRVGTNFKLEALKDRISDPSQPVVVRLDGGGTLAGTVTGIPSCRSLETMQLHITNDSDTRSWLYIQGFDRNGSYLGYRWMDVSEYRGSGLSALGARETLILTAGQVETLFGLGLDEEDGTCGRTWVGDARFSIYATEATSVQALTLTNGRLMPWLATDRP